MGCTVSLNLNRSSGAHLSHYWTMDFPSGGGQQDSAAGLVWPIVAGAGTTSGLINLGLECTNSLAGQGLVLSASPALAVDFTTSTGISFWWWVKVKAYTPPGGSLEFIFDTDDITHTSRMRMFLDFQSALVGGYSCDHTNDSSSVFFSGNLTATLGSWHMFALTYDKVAQTFNLYIDGALVNTVADALTYVSIVTGDLTLRNAPNGFGNMDLVLDEMGICQGGTLSPSQIVSLFNGDLGVTWPGVTAIVPYP